MHYKHLKFQLKCGDLKDAERNFYFSTGSPVVSWHVMGESSWSVGLRISKESTGFWAALLLLWRLRCSKCDIVWETMTLWTLAWFPLHGQLGSTQHTLFSISFSTADRNPQCRQDYRRDSILDSRYVAVSHSMETKSASEKAEGRKTKDRKDREIYIRVEPTRRLQVTIFSDQSVVCSVGAK